MTIIDNSTDVTSLEHLDFDVPCEALRTVGGEHFCPESVAWILTLVGHCDPGHRTTLLICQGHKDSIDIAVAVCAGCEASVPMKDYVLRLEPLKSREPHQ